nr:hypothetical protein [Hyphomonas sp. Mor2]
MFRSLICCAALVAGPLAHAETSFYQDRSTLERDRQALMGMRFSLSLGTQTSEMRLQLGTHYSIDGTYEFLPALSFASQDGLSGFALDGMAAEGEAGEEGSNATLWLVGGGALLLVAAAAGSGGSDEEFCPTGGLALLDLLECIDED